MPMKIFSQCLRYCSVAITLLWLSLLPAVAESDTQPPKLPISDRALDVARAIQSSDINHITQLLDQADQDADVALFADYLTGRRLLLELEGIAESDDIPDVLIAAIDHFRLASPGHPLSASLYKKILRALINREQWAAFMHLYAQDGTDYEECAERRYWLETQNNPEKALAGFKAFWTKGYRIPSLCDPIVELWKASGGAVSSDYQDKFNNAIRHGQVGVAKSALKFIDEPDKTSLQRWVQVSVKPTALISDYQQWTYPQDDALLLYGLRLLINKDSVTYKTVFDHAYEFRGSPDEKAWISLRGQLVLYLLSRNDATAVRRLFALPQSQWRDTHRDWYIRTLLRANRQVDIDQFLQRQPESYHFPSDQVVRTAHKATLEPKSEVLLEYNEITYNKILKNNNIIKSIILKYAGLDSYAIHEWRQAFRSFEEDEIVQMVYVAKAHDWPHRMIRVAADKGLWHFREALYPKPYESIFNTYADEFMVDQSLAYAIAREESHFDDRAKSSADAIGIMQLTPGSAHVIAGKLGISIKKDILYNKNINIKLGIKYLSILLKRFSHKEKAIAAYNAGPTIAATWNPHITDMDVWVSLIPYKETRLYVQRVLATEKLYKELYGL